MHLNQKKLSNKIIGELFYISLFYLMQYVNSILSATDQCLLTIQEVHRCQLRSQCPYRRDHLG